MTIRRFGTIAVVLLLAWSPARAATDAATADALLRESGLGKALGELVEHVDDEFHESLANLPKRPDAAEVARLDHLIDQAFSPDALREIAREILQKETNEADVAGLREWFASPTGRHIAKAEEAGSWKRETMQKHKREGVVLLEQMKTSRRKVLDDLLVAAHAIEISATISIRSLPTLLAAVRRAHPELPIPSEKELLARLENARPQIERALYAGSIEIYASIYRSVPDAELVEYASLMASPAGRRFTDVLGRALEAAILHGIARFGREVVPTGNDQTT
jgi:hypothetical protein